MDCVISACSVIPCSVPFSMKPLVITEEDGTETHWVIEDGFSRIINFEDEEEDSPEEFARTITYENDEIVEGEEDPMSQYVISIISALVESITRVCGRPIHEIRLTFGVDEETENIWLYRNSTLVLSKKCFEDALLQTKDASKLNNILVVEISKQVPEGICYTNSESCGPAHNIQKLIDIIYFRCNKEFPSLNKKKLLSFIRHRIKQIDPSLLDKSVSCCLPCYLRTEKAKKQFSDQPQPQNNTRKLSSAIDVAKSRETQIYQSINLNTLGNRPMHKYPSNNLINSPYSSPVKEMYKVPPQYSYSQHDEEHFVTAKSRASYNPSYNPPPSYLKTRKQIRRKDRLCPWEHYELPEHEPLPPTYSQKLAPKCYQSQLERLKMTRKTAVRK